MKNGYFVSALLLSIVSASNSFSAVGQESKGIGPGGTFLSCADRQGRTLQVENTAVPTYKTAVLDLNRAGRYQLQCRPNLNAKPPFADGFTTILNCVENRAGEGRIVVQVVSGGFAGITQAQVAREQMFPARPQPISTLICR